MTLFTSYKSLLLNLLVVVFLFSNPKLCHSIPNTNLDVFDSLTKKIATEFVKSLIIIANDTINVSFPEKNSFLIKKHIISLLSEQQNFVTENESSVHKRKIRIVIDELKTTFQKTEIKDSILRIIALKYTFFVDENGIIKKPIESKEIYKDIINLSQLSEINSNFHDFARGELPQEKPTVFEEIFEPLIIVTAAVVTIILLFTIRSN